MDTHLPTRAARGARHAASIGVVLGLLAQPVDAAECPTVHEAPTPTAEDSAFESAWQGVAEPYRATYARGHAREPNYGVGYLRVASIDDHYYDWARHVVLPLWSAPGERFFAGWLHSGRVHLDGRPSPYALTGAGLVETEYEHSSFIVYEASDRGWLRIRLAPGADGELWTHECHLEIGEARLAYEQWQSFLEAHGDWLHFRSQVPHTLRAQPSINSERVTMIGLDHKLILRELEGDWMRVVVEQPDRTCGSLAERDLEAATHEGWVKWRDAEKGPWVWTYTRGC